MFTLLREISLRHFLHSPLRTLLVIFGIALGVAMFVGIMATNASLVASFEDMVDRVAGKADFVVAGGDSGIPAELVEEIVEVPGVAHAAAMLEITTRETVSNGPLLVLGVDMLGDRHFLPFEIEEGDATVIDDPLAFINDPTAILVSARLARERGLHVGSNLSLVTSEGPKDFHIYAILDDKGPAASFEGQVAVMFLDAAQVSFARGRAIDRVDVAIEHGAKRAEVAARVARVVGSRARVETPEGRGKRLSGSLKGFQGGLYLSGLVSLMVGMFLIYNAVGVAVAQRRRELGVLRALGVTRRRVVALFCIEALLLAILGVTIGIAVGQVLGELALAQATPTVSRFFAPVRPPAPHVSLPIALAGAAAGFLSTLFAAYWPARRAAKTDPAETLRSARTVTDARTLPYRAMFVVGIVVLASVLVPSRYPSLPTGYLASLLVSLAAALMAPMLVIAVRRLLLPVVERVLGVPGRLGLDNVERSLGRSAITVVALMMAVQLSVTMGSWLGSLERSILQWIEDAVPADIIITSGSPIIDRHNVTFSPDIVQTLTGIPGVEGIQVVRSADEDLGDRRIQLLSLDSQEYIKQLDQNEHRRVIEGRHPLERNTLYEAPRILLAENTAHRMNAHPGDRVHFRTPTGDREFEVRAVVIDYSSDQGWAAIDHHWYVEYWGDESIDAVDLYLAPGANGDTVAREVRRRLHGRDALFVTQSAELKTEIRKVVLGTLSYAKSSEIITLVIALMGVVGTMLAAVIDRLREIGVLRAIGATRRQLVLTVVTEAGFLGFVAVLGGVLSGIPQGLVFVHVLGYAVTAWSLQYTFPVEVALRIGGLVLLTAAAAGFFPGRRAASMDPKEALAYE